jgi:hypothetical protein
MKLPNKLKDTIQRTKITSAEIQTGMTKRIHETPEYKQASQEDQKKFDEIVTKACSRKDEYSMFEMLDIGKEIVTKLKAAGL